jgi:hypothetical protein
MPEHEIGSGALSPPRSESNLPNHSFAVAIPDYCSTPGNKGAYALLRMEGNSAHFLMVTFWESEEAIRAFAGDDISVGKYYDFDRDFLIEMEPCSMHYEMYDKQSDSNLPTMLRLVREKLKAE